MLADPSPSKVRSDETVLISLAVQNFLFKIYRTESADKQLPSMQREWRNALRLERIAGGVSRREAVEVVSPPFLICLCIGSDKAMTVWDLKSEMAVFDGCLVQAVLDDLVHLVVVL